MKIDVNSSRKDKGLLQSRKKSIKKCIKKCIIRVSTCLIFLLSILFCMKILYIESCDWYVNNYPINKTQIDFNFNTIEENMLIGYHTLFLASNDFAIKRVVENNRIIIEIARKYHIDPDLIRSIIMEEMYHSSIIGQHPNLEASMPELLIKTRGIMKTTINSNQPYHKKINAKEARNCYQSIDAGAFLLRAEIDRLVNQREELSIALIASRYNNHYSSRITQYGKRVENHYINRPWLENIRKAEHI